MNCTGDCNQGRRQCCTPQACELIQHNSDGTSPHAETRDLVEMAMDAALVLLALAMLTFTIFSAIGFWSAR